MTLKELKYIIKDVVRRKIYEYCNHSTILNMNPIVEMTRLNKREMGNVPSFSNYVKMWRIMVITPYSYIVKNIKPWLRMKKFKHPYMTNQEYAMEVWEDENEINNI